MTQAGVIYVSSEAGSGMRLRLLAALEHHGFSRSLPFALVVTAPDLGHRDGDAPRLVADIRAQLPPGFRPGLIVLDTLAKSMVGADESGSGGMGIFVHNADRLGQALGATVMPIHHTGKDLERGMRGSSALLAAADTVWRVGPDALFFVEKMKEERSGYEVAFTLARKAIGEDSDGDDITTYVVEVGEAVLPAEPVAEVEPASEAQPLRDGTATFLRALTLIIERHCTTLSRFKLIPKTAKVVRQADLKSYSEIELMTSSPASRRTQIDTFVRELERQGSVRRHAGYVWLAAPAR